MKSALITVVLGLVAFEVSSVSQAAPPPTRPRPTPTRPVVKPSPIPSVKPSPTPTSSIPSPTPSPAASNAPLPMPLPNAAAGVCNLPLCQLATEVERVSNLNHQADRLAALAEYQKLLLGNPNLSVLEHLASLADTLATQLAAQNEEEWVVRQAHGLGQDAWLALASNSPLDASRLAIYYSRITDPARRLQAATTWSERFNGSAEIAKNKPVLLELGHFFARALEISRASADPEYVSNFLDGAGQAIVAKILELYPADTTGCLAESCDVATELKTFRSWKQPTRFAVIRLYRSGVTISTNPKLLSNVTTFAESLISLLQELHEADWLIAEATSLMGDGLLGLAKAPELEATKLASLYGRIRNVNDRYAVVELWKSRIAAQADPASLRELQKFFALALQISQTAADPAYLITDLDYAVQTIYRTLIQLFPNEAAACLDGTCDPAQELEKFKTWRQNERQAVIRLYRAGVLGMQTEAGAARLALIAALAQTLEPALKAAGEAEWLVTEVHLLAVDCWVGLVTFSGADAKKLADLYSLLKGEARRYAVLTTWRKRGEGYSDRKSLAELRDFFAHAAQISEADHDPAYIVSEARADSATIIARLAKLP